jgi:excinuclease ABC subunit C
LDAIPGVGEKTKSLLIKHFGSVKRVKSAQKTDLQALLGKVKGEKLYENLHPGDAQIDN